ncbi:MAG: pseudouridine synthase, partial [Myxococcales bacterium]|nr:pseudouridine synthase [Myxococcales bacterium]
GPRFVLQTLRDQIRRYVYPIHRLDRATSGALAFALSPDHAREAQQAMQQGQFEKHYLALVRGTPRERFVIDEPMRNDGGEEPVEAITEVQRLFVTEHGFSLVRALPRTGRRHQIRRHLRRHHHELGGDVNHGKGPINRRLRAEFGLHRLALHALALHLPHPQSGAPLRLQARLPEDLRAPLRRMGVPEALLRSLEMPGSG